jgi:hypothetical protein
MIPFRPAYVRCSPGLVRCSQAMQRRLREEELKVLRGHAKVDERALDDAIDADAAETRAKRPAGASTRGRGADGGGVLRGGMAPEEESESGEEDDLGEEEESADGDSQVRECPSAPARARSEHVAQSYLAQCHFAQCHITRCTITRCTSPRSRCPPALCAVRGPGVRAPGPCALRGPTA